MEIIAIHGIIEEYHVLKYRLLIENELVLISRSCMICEGNHLENKCTALYPSQSVREDLRDNGGISNMERRPYQRKYYKKGGKAWI